MTKLIKKSKCKFEAGHIVKGNKIIGIPYVVWLQLSKLEVMTQQYDYLAKQPAYQAGPSLDGFERKSALESERPYVKAPKTPVADQMVQEAIAFMEEHDAASDAAEINETIDVFGSLVDWCSADKFVEGDCYKKIDLYNLGNPLELEAKDIVQIIEAIVKSPLVIEE